MEVIQCVYVKISMIDKKKAINEMSDMQITKIWAGINDNQDKLIKANKDKN